MKIVRESILNEELLKKDKFEFEIDYGIDSTVHSEQRKSRIDNDGSEITNEEITQDIDAALDEITHDLMFDKLNIGDKIIIKNAETKLNIVTQLQSREYSNVILFKIVTVMRKENFWINRDTKKVIKV